MTPKKMEQRILHYILEDLKDEKTGKKPLNHALFYFGS